MKTKMIIPLFLMVLFFPIVSATSIEIDMKESFGINEQVSFKYTIISEKSQEIDYVASVNCPNAPIPLLDIKTINLEANVPFTETYPYLTVREDIEPQVCKAIVGILSPEEISEEKSFAIETNPGFEFDVLTCKDLNCAEKIKVFILNENIYLDYTSEVSEPIIIVILTYPDKSTNKLTLPTLIKAEQIGTYELEVKASKENYRTITKKIQFGVIEQEVKIDYIPVREITVCNNNGICDAGENYENCPKDCIILKERKPIRIYLIITIIVVIIAVIGIFVYFKIFKKRQMGNEFYK